MEMMLAGHSRFERAFAFFAYDKGGVTQQLIHTIKYRNVPKLGYYLGKQMGLEQEEQFAQLEADYIIPIPLSWRKKHKRGYNQSDFIADGLADAIGIPVLKKAVKRKHPSASQTSKNRLKRFDALENQFFLSEQNSAYLENKRIIIVDDVITTGATLSALGRVLVRQANCQIVYCTLAKA